MERLVSYTLNGGASVRAHIGETTCGRGAWSGVPSREGDQRKPTWKLENREDAELGVGDIRRSLTSGNSGKGGGGDGCSLCSPERKRKSPRVKGES